MDTRYGVGEDGQTKQTVSGKSDAVDIGFVKPFGGMVVPPGYLYCDGSDVSRQAYDKLFAAIGTTWGEGDGENTFNIPDLRGIFIRCDGGENNADIGVRQEDAIRDIPAGISAQGSNSGNMTPIWAGAGFRKVTHSNGTATTNSATQVPYYSLILDVAQLVPVAPEVRPVNMAMKYCIRYE